jgi:hypothetical protein
MCRIGGRLGSPDASPDGAAVEIPLFCGPGSNPSNTRGQCLVVSLAGAAASQIVTEASKGSLRTDGNRPTSALA